MKTPAELAECSLDSPEAHKRCATQIKRLAGGLRSQLMGADRLGLTPAEHKKLAEAAELLESLSGRYSQASRLAKKRQDDLAHLEAKVTEAIASTFGALNTIEDKVVLIAAVQSYQLRQNSVKDIMDLEFYAKDAMSSLVRMLAKQAKSVALGQVTSQAWEKFTNGRNELAGTYRHIIDALTKQRAPGQP